MFDVVSRKVDCHGAELKQNLLSCKNRMEAKGLKVTVAKTKVMTGGVGLGTIEEFGSNACGVCCKGVE